MKKEFDDDLEKGAKNFCLLCGVGSAKYDACKLLTCSNYHTVWYYFGWKKESEGLKNSGLSKDIFLRTGTGSPIHTAVLCILRIK